MTVVGGVTLKVVGDNRDFKRSLKDAERATDRATDTMKREFGEVERSSERLNRSIRGTSLAMTALSTAAVGAVGVSAVRTIASFEQAMSTVQAVTNATAQQMEALNAQAQLLGSTTRFSASQAADGMIFLARAGFSVDEVLSSITGTLQLAQAGGIELGRAADIASNALSGFGLQADQMPRILDVLALAANSANTDINQLGEALKFAAPAAVALGISVEETVAVVGKLSDAGIQAGLAGRGFQALSVQFVNQRDKIEALIGSYDLAEEGLANVVGRLVAAGITTEQVAEIFRGENLDVFTVLANATGDAAGSVNELTRELENSAGTIQRVAEIMDDNLQGAIFAAQSALEALILAFGELGTSSGVRSALEGLADLLRAAARNADIVAAAIVALTVRAVLPLVSTLGGPLVAAAGNAVGAMLGVEGAAARATKSIGGLRGALAIFGGPVTAAISAAAGVMALMAIRSEETASAVDQANEALTRSREILARISELAGSESDNPFAVIGDAAETATNRLDGMLTKLTELGEGLQELSQQGKTALAFELQASIDQTRIALERLEGQRSALGTQTGRAVRPEVLASRQAEFDDSAEGQRLVQLRQQLALQQRALERLDLSFEDFLGVFGNKTDEVTDATKGAINGAGDDRRRIPLDDIPETILGTGAAAPVGAVNPFVLADQREGRAAAAADGGSSTLGDLETESFEALSRFELNARWRMEQALMGAIESGDWGDAFQEGIRGAAQAGLESAISEGVDLLFDMLKGGGFGDIFGLGGGIAGLFGGNRASGGSVMAGQAYRVGERGSELFVPGMDGFILPNASNVPRGSDGPGQSVINVNTTLNVSGDPGRETVDLIRQELGDYSRNLPAAIRAEMADARRRDR